MGLLIFAAASMLALTAALALAPVSTNDLWIHLKTGDLILQTGHVPQKDPYSFTAADHDYVAHEWLSAVLFALVYRALGVHGLIALKCVLAVAIATFLVLACLRRGSRLGVILPAFGLMSYVAGGRYLERPHLFSYFFLSAYVFLFFQYRDGGRRRGWLLAMLPLQVLWANMHAGFVEGILLLGVFALGDTLVWVRDRYLLGFLSLRGVALRDDPRKIGSPPNERLVEGSPPYQGGVRGGFGMPRQQPPPGPLLGKEGVPWPNAPAPRGFGSPGERRPLFPRDLVLLWSLPALAILACLINPYGVRLLEFPFRLTGMDVFMREVFEWRPLLDPLVGMTFMFAGYWAWMVLLLASFWSFDGEGVPAARRGRLRVANGLFLAGLVVFAYAFMWRPQWVVEGRWLWLGVAVLFCAANVSRLDFTAVGLVAAMFALSLRHNRGMADTVIVTLPVLTHNLSGLVGQVERQWRARRRPAPSRVRRSHPFTLAAMSLVLLAEAGDVLWSGYRYDWHSTRERGLGIADIMPVCAVDYVVRSGITGNAYTSYGAAALLIYRAPNVKVSMDSRNDVYGPDLFREYTATKGSAAAMRAYLGRYRVDFLLLSTRDVAPAVVADLLRSGEWVQVFFDHRAAVLVRNTPAFAAVVAADGYRQILPLAAPDDRVPPGQGEAYLKEATRALGFCPNSWLPQWYRMQALMQLRRYDDALQAGLQLVHGKPDAWYAWVVLGQLYAKRNDTAHAAESYAKAVALNPAAQRYATVAPAPVAPAPRSAEGPSRLTGWPSTNIVLDPNELLLDADADPLNGDAPLAVRFTAAPFDPGEARQPKYRWSFGDGSPETTEQNPRHTYERPGSFTAKVMVTEEGGKSGTEEFDISVYEVER